MSGRDHAYSVEVAWTGNLGPGTSSYTGYSRDCSASAPGRADIEASSDPAFRGDPSRRSPEELFVAALSQCHLLWYLRLCADAGIVVMAYVDRAQGAMRVEPDGSGQFTDVPLRPHVCVADQAHVEPALRLHATAGSMCFLARSVSFPVRHDPVVVVAGR